MNQPVHEPMIVDGRKLLQNSENQFISQGRMIDHNKIAKSLVSIFKNRFSLLDKIS